MASRGESRPIRVAVAHRSYLVRESLTSVLGGSEAVEQIATCASGTELEDTIALHPPDVVLTSVRLPPAGDDGGIRIAAQLRESSPEVGVVALGHHIERSSVLAFLGEGARRRAYLLTERIHSKHDLIEAIKTVATGGSAIDPLIVDVLIHGGAQTAGSRLSELTPREHEVLSKIALGDSNDAIASSLWLTKRAVEKHINSIFWKLDLHDQDNVSRRVVAARIFLAESQQSPAGRLVASGHHSLAA